MSEYVKSGTLIVIVLAFFIQFNIFWKPEQIQAFAAENLVSKIEFKMLYDEMKYIRKKIDAIYKIQMKKCQ
ncbi:MAG: hypothetical protein U9P90_02235 [Patescibacteria group bacterium]|nr:hypothetical protein [Patescibacteria group bacterium]